MRKTVLGLIGTGGISQSQHLPNLMRAPHVYLKTVCDKNEELLARMREKYRVPNATAEVDDLLADPEIEGVVVATREDMQAKLTIRALAAGKHVYVEKPLAATVEECEEVVEAQRRAGKFVVVGFNRRQAPSYLRARELLNADGGAQNIYYRISDEYWRWGKGNPPGVRVIHEVCHIFDVLRWIVGSEVVSIYCACSRPDDEIYTMKFASGCVATILNSGYATRDFPKERFEAISQRGSVTVEEFVELRAFGYPGVAPMQRFAGHTHPDREFAHKHIFSTLGAEGLYAFRRMGWEYLHQQENGGESGCGAEIETYMNEHAPHWNYMVDKGWLGLIDHFAQCIQENRLPEAASARDGFVASQLCHAAIKSRETGEVVRL